MVNMYIYMHFGHIETANIVQTAMQYIMQSHLCMTIVLYIEQACIKTVTGSHCLYLVESRVGSD